MNSRKWIRNLYFLKIEDEVLHWILSQKNPRTLENLDTMKLSINQQSVKKLIHYWQHLKKPKKPTFLFPNPKHIKYERNQQITRSILIVLEQTKREICDNRIQLVISKMYLWKHNMNESFHSLRENFESLQFHH